MSVKDREDAQEDRPLTQRERLYRRAAAIMGIWIISMLVLFFDGFTPDWGLVATLGVAGLGFIWDRTSRLNDHLNSQDQRLSNIESYLEYSANHGRRPFRPKD